MVRVFPRSAEYFNITIDYIVRRTDIRRPIERTEAFHLNQEEAEMGSALSRTQ